MGATSFMETLKSRSDEKNGEKSVMADAGKLVSTTKQALASRGTTPSIDLNTEFNKSGFPAAMNPNANNTVKRKHLAKYGFENMLIEGLANQNKVYQ